MILIWLEMHHKIGPISVYIFQVNLPTDGVPMDELELLMLCILRVYQEHHLLCGSVFKVKLELIC